METALNIIMIIWAAASLLIIAGLGILVMKAHKKDIE